MLCVIHQRIKIQYGCHNFSTILVKIKSITSFLKVEVDIMCGVESKIFFNKRVQTN